MNPCIHLDHTEGKFTDCTLRTMEPHYPDLKYWERGDTWIDRDQNGRPQNPVKVQFCRLRGRINAVFPCYNGEMVCYEPEAKP